MVISFEVKNRFKGGKPNFSNVKTDNKETLQFPQDGVDITFIHDGNYYKVFFDTEVELDDSNIITPIIKEVKRLYLRKFKIKKINERKK